VFLNKQLLLCPNCGLQRSLHILIIKSIDFKLVGFPVFWLQVCLMNIYSRNMCARNIYIFITFTGSITSAVRQLVPKGIIPNFDNPVKTLSFSCSLRLIKLFGFPIFWPWAYLMKVISEMSTKLYIHVLMYFITRKKCCKYKNGYHSGYKICLWK